MDAKKFQYIQTQIQEARAALQNWNERRTEVMIELDSIFCEVQLLEHRSNEEISAAKETIAELNSKIAGKDNEFNLNFKAYTNEMQEMKLAKEDLSSQLQEAKNEIENQKQAQKKMEAAYDTKIAKMASEAEIGVADERYQLKNQVAELVAQLNSIVTEKKTIAQKAETFERELQEIRSQMMSMLRVTNTLTAESASVKNVAVKEAKLTKGGGTTATPKNPTETPMEQVRLANANAEVAKALQDAIEANESRENAFIPREVAPAPKTMTDYLKKFGY